MRFELDDLPSDVDLLHALVRDMADAVETRDDEIDRLKRLIQQFQRGQFGRRSEQLDPDQMALSLEDLDAGQAREQESHAELPLEDVTRLPEADQQPKTLPAHLERTDVLLDWVPARLRVIRIRRPRYGCRSCGTIHQSPVPERPIAKGRATPGLLAQVLVSKYSDHTPLYQQSRIFARQGV